MLIASNQKSIKVKWESGYVVLNATKPTDEFWNVLTRAIGRSPI